MQNNVEQWAYGLGERASNALLRGGLHSVEDIQHYIDTGESLMELADVGAITEQEIMRWLGSRDTVTAP